MSIADPMIARKRNGDYRARPNGAIDHPRPGHDFAETNDRYLRRIDDA